MASYVITHANWPAYRTRFEQLAEDTPRRWGAMSPAKMVRHLRQVTEISLAEIEVPDESTWFSRTIFAWLVYNVLPWPKGKIKAPDTFSPDPKDHLAKERERFFVSFERFLNAADRNPHKKTVHQMFGLRTLENWRKIHGKHFDHHLRQFGL